MDAAATGVLGWHESLLPALCCSLPPSQPQVAQPPPIPKGRPTSLFSVPPPAPTFHLRGSWGNYSQRFIPTGDLPCLTRCRRLGLSPQQCWVLGRASLLSCSAHASNKCFSSSCLTPGTVLVMEIKPLRNNVLCLITFVRGYSWASLKCPLIDGTKNLEEK